MEKTGYPERIGALLQREFLIASLRIRTLFLLLVQRLRDPSSGERSGPDVHEKVVAVIIPFPGEGRVSKQREDYYMRGLKNLLTLYLPAQMHGNYSAVVYCDGPNCAAEALVAGIADRRVSYRATDGRESNWGHAQTRLGIEETTADFVVRMNCDNRPFSDYLSALLSGFSEGVDAVYARVIYSGMAAREHLPSFSDYPNELGTFVLPKDAEGRLEFRNIDCMNYMVRAEAAKRHSGMWSGSYVSDWEFIEAVTKSGPMPVFVDRIIGCKS